MFLHTQTHTHTLQTEARSGCRASQQGEETERIEREGGSDGERVRMTVHHFNSGGSVTDTFILGVNANTFRKPKRV